MTHLQGVGRRALCVAIVGAMCGGWCAAGSPAIAAPATWTSNGWKTTPDVWGVNDVRLTGEASDATVATRAAAIKKTGAKWVRYTVNWAEIQRGGPGSYDFSQTDRTIARLALYGIRWRPILHDPPAWLTADPTFHMRQPATSSAAIAEFLYVFLARYGPGGTIWTQNRGWLPAMPVLDVELHNEPNAAYHWGVDPATWNYRTDYTGEAWANLYGKALDSLRPAVQPNVRFWMGGLVPAPGSTGVPATTFIHNAFNAYPSLRNTLAGVALHLYPYSGSPQTPSTHARVYSLLGQAVWAMRTYGRADMAIQVNEIGMSMLEVPNEQNRIDLMNAMADLARSNCPIYGGLAPYTDIDWEDDPTNPARWHSMVSPATGELYSHGAAWASKVAAFNAGTVQGTELNVC